MKLFCYIRYLILQKGRKEAKMIFSKKSDESKRNLVEQIILENYNQYYRLAYNYVHNEADASDIVQNGAYKSLKNSYMLKHPECAGTWIYRIMLNECFKYLKHPQMLSYEDIQEKNKTVAVIEDKYEDIDMQRALSLLQDKDRAVIILKYFEDKKLDDIADILNENVSTVKSRLYRSLKKLRTIMSDETKQDSSNLNSRSKIACKY